MKKIKPLEEKPKKTFFISAERYNQILQEYNYRTEEKRAHFAIALELARAEGDDRECGALSASYDLLGENDIKVIELDEILRNSQIIKFEDLKPGKRAKLGSILNIEMNGKKQTVSLCDPAEADPTIGKVSVESPIGQALLGKKQGDNEEVEIGGRKMKLRIKS